ncbi:hypothetical protein SF1_42030 [Sphingobacterium faecium NBRC 15299]|uniref:beta-1,6-N-acetylglucosaminyltransferase n=1 Tax=Sphingobacterium faecium TaxID=34087 RepID=UPI000D396C17|nr:beta-1,6-N-acetylglucosaminyltransferase [Sphingobacterium faecium]PTX06972.1 core-2/I-Branching enzyme [Sphingobacterium faecium]GEM66221.1 hypothetical protein SF1_42030 [Sphingobacterium faecium NBRC 15299]
MINNAFLIICHKNEVQICELIKTILTQKHNHCIVFCDLNFTIKKTLKKLSITQARVEIIHSNFKIQWGEFSMVRASLILLEKAYNSQNNFKYFHLISGQDFPIKSIREIANFFKNNDRIYIDYFMLPRKDGQWFPNGGMDRYINNNPNKHYIPNNIKSLYGGSQWWSITRESVLYIFNYLDSNPSYLTFYKDTFIPDESFFQTILLNSEKLNKKIVNNNLRYIDWESGPTYPKILMNMDFWKIVQSDCIFARKIDQIENTNIIDLLKIYIQ